MSITEKIWKVVKEVCLGWSTVQWFAKFFEDCLKGDTSGSYTTVNEGYRNFIAQWCSNGHGHYTVLAEYSGRSRRSFIFIPKEKERGGGWLKQCGSLHQKEEALTLTEGGGGTFELVAAHQQPSCSYKEVLETEHLCDRP